MGDSRIYGPALPASTSTKQESDKDNTSETIITSYEEKPDVQTYGPVLPPHLQKSKESEIVSMGPTLPPKLRENLKYQADEAIKNTESSEEEEMYGPLLPGQKINSLNAIALEERALEIKLSQLNPEDQKKEREEWMIELPTVSASKLGLGPRQFKPNAGPDMTDR